MTATLPDEIRPVMESGVPIVLVTCSAAGEPNVAVVPVEMGWSDLGGWDALYQQRAKDGDGNVIQGDVVSVNSRNSLLWSDHGTLATLNPRPTSWTPPRRTQTRRIWRRLARARTAQRGSVARDWLAGVSASTGTVISR